MKFFLLVILISLETFAAEAPPVHVGRHIVDVGMDVPSCRIIRHRLIHEDKLFEEWKTVSDKLVRDPSQKHRNEMLSLIKRVQSVGGQGDIEKVRLEFIWDLPPDIANRNLEDLIVSLRMPTLDWLSPITQLPLTVKITFSDSELHLTTQLDPVEYCLGDPQIVLELGTGWEAPFANINNIEHKFVADAAIFREKVFFFIKREEK